MLRLVLNLNTGVEIYFDGRVSPEDAVRVAYLMDAKRYKGPGEDLNRVGVVRGKRTVACGDFATLN